MQLVFAANFLNLASVDLVYPGSRAFKRRLIKHVLENGVAEELYLVSMAPCCSCSSLELPHTKCCRRSAQRCNATTDSISDAHYRLTYLERHRMIRCPRQARCRRVQGVTAH